MRNALLIPVLGLALAAGTPAFAQSSSQSSSSQSGSGQKSGATATQPHAQIQAMSQDKLRKQLEQAGFKNVQVLDAAYLVQAQTQDGDQVLMTINPPSHMSGSSASASGSHSGSGQSGSNPSSGTPKQ